MSKHQTRVSAYLDRCERARGIDTEHIHGFDGGGDDPGFLLLQSDLRALLADLERAEKDAERYRFLRDEQIGNCTESINLKHGNKPGLDAAIDAAMAQMAGGG